MDDKNIIKLDIKPSDVETKKSHQMVNSSFLQTNPILQKMFVKNISNKKGKFNFKDLFR